MSSKGKKRSRALAELSEPDSDSDAEVTSKRKTRSKATSKSPTKKKSSKSPTKSKSKTKSKYASDSESDEEDDDLTISELKSKSGPKSKSKSKTKTKSKTSNSNSSSSSSSSKSKSKSKQEEEEDEFAPPRKKSRRVAANAQKKKDEFASGFDYQVEEDDSLIVVYPKDWTSRSKLACFDMDSTLVCPKGKNKFPKGRSDWKWQFASVPSKLKSLYNEENFRLVIFTNQGGIGTGKQRASDIYGKIIDLSNALGLPLTALISTQKDKNRKPNTFMFDYFIEHLHKSGGAANGSNSNNSSSSSSEKTKKDAGDEKGDGIDWENSFYCGDAAGRPAAWNGDKKTKKDFSVSDRKFAANVGIKFCTPEPLFLRHKEYANFDWRAMDPKEYLKQNPEENYEKTETWFHGKLPVAKKDGLDMVIMCGPPGAGKSTIATQFLQSKGYVWVNRDTLKTQAKCQKLATTALEQGKNVVIDNTNPDSTARAPYVQIAKKYKAHVRIFFMNVTKELAEHMNLYREKMTDGDRKRIPGMVFNMFFKKLREDGGKPDAKREGVDEVVTIDFVPKFENDELRKLFLQWT